MNEDIVRNPANRNQEPTWVKNEHGVTSCWPQWRAKEMVDKGLGWSYSEKEEVPEQKQYPIGIGELTPTGLQRRLAAQESVKESKKQVIEEIEQEVTLADLRKKAKELGVEKSWVKSAARLKKEITDIEKVTPKE